MALLITKDNKPIFLQSRQANLLWLVSTGEREGTPKTQKLAMKINKWYLNRDNAPESYLKAYPPYYYKHRHNRPLPYQIRLPYAD